MSIKGTYPGKTITVENAATDIPQGSVIGFAGDLQGVMTSVDGYLGVSVDYPALAGEHFTVVIDGIVNVATSGTGSAGDALVTVSGGKVKTQDGSAPIVGYALDDFVDASFVRMRLA